ncbi:hypothetical protein J6590_076151 [Homalodisca vitripennis]|nr:hypothetical protein J6590_076151 [Homalodisca vitripennis]
MRWGVTKLQVADLAGSQVTKYLFPHMTPNLRLNHPSTQKERQRLDKCNKVTSGADSFVETRCTDRGKWLPLSQERANFKRMSPLEVGSDRDIKDGRLGVETAFYRDPTKRFTQICVIILEERDFVM